MRTSRRLLRTTALLLLGVVLIGGAPGCNAVDKRYWGFPIYSTMYRGIKESKGSTRGTGSGTAPTLCLPQGKGAEYFLLAVGAFFAALLAADLAAMVVTLPHDLCVGRPCKDGDDGEVFYDGFAPEHR